MLRSKKFNILKYLGLNGLFRDYGYNHDELKLSSELVLHDDDITDYTQHIYIKQSDKYEIVKEEILDIYILKLRNNLVIHLTKKLIQDFEFLYKKSKKYVFDIYETMHPDLTEEDTYIKMYHIFCISEELNEINYIQFLRANDSDSKYYALSKIYGPSLIMNKRFDITSEHDKYNVKYKYVKTIGRGIIDYSIRNFIKLMLQMLNEYQNTLPPHYLKIN
jgi:hypothetical protein